MSLNNSVELTTRNALRYCLRQSYPLAIRSSLQEGGPLHEAK